MARILDLTFPDSIYCICCGDLINKSRYHGLCDKCIDSITWSCENHFLHSLSSFAFDDVLSCCIYGNSTRTIIYKMKLYSSPYIARFVAKFLAERIKLSQSEDDLKVDYLIPVPCTKNKLLKRGFNQAALLSEYTSKIVQIPTNNSLKKAKDTKQSKSVFGQERFFVQKGAFFIDEKDKPYISNKNILLVDDVITTGSTADECARVLKEAGAKWVGVLCFASCREFGGVI